MKVLRFQGLQVGRNHKINFLKSISKQCSSLGAGKSDYIPSYYFGVAGTYMRNSPRHQKPVCFVCTLYGVYRGNVRIKARVNSDTQSSVNMYVVVEGFLVAILF